MKEVKNLLLGFAIVGLLVSVSIIEVEAGCAPTPVADCIDCCKSNCNAGQFKTIADCQGLPKEEKKECLTLVNITAQCCYIDCVEESCAVGAEDAPEESVVCELLDEACGDPD